MDTNYKEGTMTDWTVTCKTTGFRTPVVTISINGVEVKTRSPRRYVVVTFRAQDVQTPEGWYVKFAEVVKRTDSRDTAKREVYRRGIGSNGVRTIAVDTATGQVVR